jgi:hypothetical protein
MSYQHLAIFLNYVLVELFRHTRPRGKVLAAVIMELQKKENGPGYFKET